MSRVGGVQGGGCRWGTKNMPRNLAAPEGAGGFINQLLFFPALPPTRIPLALIPDQFYVSFLEFSVFSFF